ncbi:DNA translocase FtsK [Marinobacterium jannaschii]|uniref:DNA translocase FtsK n=1 Tax=Marinobacterium jannaschii TaxID=64970 RepID=UPI00047F226A|nr:DNA translocase FtsK [Marinobacterium jannaschii]
MNAQHDFVDVHDEVFDTSAKTMHADLMGIIREACKAMPDVWQRLSKEKQQDFLDSWDAQLETVVESCIMHIASDNRPHVIATVDQVVFKGGIEAKLKIEKGMSEDGAPSGAHDLADATGEKVMIILPGADEYEPSEGDKPTAEDDQPDLLDSASDPLYDEAVAFVRESGKTSISALQRDLKIGYNRAARLIDMMEQVGIVGPRDDKGQREVIG